VKACDAASGPGAASGPDGAGTLGDGRPRGNPNLAPRCGARTRAGLGCRAPGMANGRCRIHGGTSTGPRTAKGFSRLAAAHTTCGTYSAAKWARDRELRVIARRIRLYCAAGRVRAYLPPALAARLDTMPPEFMPLLDYPSSLKSEITTKTLRSGRPVAGGLSRSGPSPSGLSLSGLSPSRPSTARARPGLRGRAAELEAARAERQTLAPWRAAIAEARLAKRAALAARRQARIAKYRQRPYGTSPSGRTGSAGRGEEGVAVDARLGPAPVGAAPVGAAAREEAGIDATVQEPRGAVTVVGMRAAANAPQAAGGPVSGSMGGGVPWLAGGSTAAVTQSTPAVTKSENHDKDPMEDPATGGPCPTRACHRACPGGALDPGIGPGGRTARWSWGGLKGRLCRGTPLGGLLPGVTQPGTWQAVLEANNAEEARKRWRPPHAATAGAAMAGVAIAGITAVGDATVGAATGIQAARCRSDRSGTTFGTRAPPGQAPGQTPGGKGLQAKTTLQPDGRNENRCHALDDLVCGWSLVCASAAPSIPPPSSLAGRDHASGRND